jgi:hypothetical protein
MAHQCFCGCGRSLRFQKARLSKLGMRVATRVEALKAARPQFDGNTVGVLDEFCWRGDVLVTDWQHLAHGERAIIAADRLATAEFEEECDVLLKLVRERPELVGQEANVADLRHAIEEGSRLPPTRPMYEDVDSATFRTYRRDADGPD